jgi:hypothetical protein
MAEYADQMRAGSQLPGLLIPGLVPPLLGVLAFALLRESYTWFYGRYGVVPEDVGISQIRMLTGSCGCSTSGRCRSRAARRRAS